DCGPRVVAPNPVAPFFQLVRVTLGLGNWYLPRTVLLLRKAMQALQVPAQRGGKVLSLIGVELPLEFNGYSYRLGQHLLIPHIGVLLAIIAHLLADKRGVFSD